MWYKETAYMTQGETLNKATEEDTDGINTYEAIVDKKTGLVTGAVLMRPQVFERTDFTVYRDSFGTVMLRRVTN
jgi:hypothetical protein